MVCYEQNVSFAGSKNNLKLVRTPFNVLIHGF